MRTRLAHRKGMVIGMKHGKTGYPSIDKPWLNYYKKELIDRVNEGSKQTIFQHIKAVNSERLDFTAMEYFGVKISYQMLFEKINLLSRALRAYGVLDGDFVTLCLPNIPELVYFVYALNKIGAIACLVDPRTNAEGILQRTNDSKSKILVVITDIFGQKIAPIYDQLTVKTVVKVSPADSATWGTFRSAAVRLLYAAKDKKCTRPGLVAFKEFIKQEKSSTEDIEVPFQKNKPAVVVYTSGSTGTPKGVLISNENMISGKMILESDSSDLQPNASFLGVIPFFTAYGSVDGMHNSLACGWRIILIPKYKPQDFGKLLLKFKTPCALGVPMFWSNLAKNRENVNLAFLKKPICGGDKISSVAIQRINDYFSKNGAERLIIGYGATEFGGAIAVTTAKGPYDVESTGELLPGVIGMAIDADTEEELGYDCDGELCFYSPTMMLGYLNNSEATEQITLYKNGVKFYRTGDKGHISERGSVYVIDRYKRVMIRPDGHTVHTTLVENTIMLHPSVDICAAVGCRFNSVSDFGVIPAAFIVLKGEAESENLLIDDIDSLCTNKLPERDKAHIYIILEKLPYTPMGKIDYKALESMDIMSLPYFVKDTSFIAR